jgi:hypothetical protein
MQQPSSWSARVVETYPNTLLPAPTSLLYDADKYDTSANLIEQLLACRGFFAVAMVDTWWEQTGSCDAQKPLMSRRKGYQDGRVAVL